MPAGRYTPLSRLRQALKALPEAQQGLAKLRIEEILRIIRGAPEDKSALLAGPVGEVQALLGLLEGRAHEQAIERFEALVQQAQEEVRAKGLARSKEVYRARQREVAEAREQAQQEAAGEIERLRYALKCLTGPIHTPPKNARTVTSHVARPPIQASTWTDGPWTCLRLEERTIGYHEEKAYITDNGIPALRYDPETKKWMDWLVGLAEELDLMPTGQQVRLVFFPGLSYTFAAWMEVPNRPVELLHPMDPDNAVAASLDPLQTTPYRGSQRTHGAYANDTQVVDLLVFRIPQLGEAPVDRITLRMQARKQRKSRAAERDAIVRGIIDAFLRTGADASAIAQVLSAHRPMERRALAAKLLKKLPGLEGQVDAGTLADLHALLAGMKLRPKKQA